MGSFTGFSEGSILNTEYFPCETIQLFKAATFWSRDRSLFIVSDQLYRRQVAIYRADHLQLMKKVSDWCIQQEAERGVDFFECIHGVEREGDDVTPEDTLFWCNCPYFKSGEFRWDEMEAYQDQS